MATTGTVKADSIRNSFFTFVFHFSSSVDTFSGLSIVSSYAHPVRCGSWPKVGQSAAFDAAAIKRNDTNMSRVRVIRRDMQLDRKSTRLNSSHVATSYAVFCLKQK